MLQPSADSSFPDMVITMSKLNNYSNNPLKTLIGQEEVLEMTKIANMILEQPPINNFYI